MSILKRILTFLVDIYIYSGIHIALCASAMILQSLYAVGKNHEINGYMYRVLVIWSWAILEQNHFNCMKYSLLLYSNIIFSTERNQKLACNKFYYCTSAINLQNSWRHQWQNISLNQFLLSNIILLYNKRVIAWISCNIKFYSGQYSPIFMQ